MSSEYIPFEIQEEILKRLPVKPLLQFRSISKSYKHLIDSPDFIFSYGVHQPSYDRFFLWYINRHCKAIYVTFFGNIEDDGFIQQHLVPTFPDRITIFSVAGSSHGLLCFTGYYFCRDGCYLFPDGETYLGLHMVVLWNPSIRKSVGIQVPYVYDEKIDNYEFNVVIGFGVCPVTLDPTVLKIKFIIDYKRKKKDMPGISFPWKVRVFTLSTATWSVLSTNLPRESIRLRNWSQVVIDRFIYWIAYDYMFDAEDGPSQSHSLLMSFDLTAKEFKEINLTGCLTHRLCRIQTISKLHESLVMLEYHSEFQGDVSVCSLWMMKKQCGNISFTKLYNINVPHATVKKLLGFRKTGELILTTQLQNKNHAKLEIYDPSLEAIDNLGIEGNGDYGSFFMCSYTETLLLHDELDGSIYWISKQSQIEDVECITR